MNKNRFNSNMKTTSTLTNDMSDKDSLYSNGTSGAKNTPEIDIPKPSNATKVFPDEVPRRDGPGGE